MDELGKVKKEKNETVFIEKIVQEDKNGRKKWRIKENKKTITSLNGN